jgi:hypothetical protein
MTTPRQRATNRLVTALGGYRYPSHQMLDRLEASLRTPEDLEAYALMLDELYMQGQRHPSLRLMDRLDECALAHELVTHRRQHEADARDAQEDST